MDSHFPHFYRTNIHSLINIDMTKIPQILRFKGFGKMNMKLYPEQPIDDVEANRNVHVAFTGKLCPYIGNDKSVLLTSINNNILLNKCYTNY